MSPTQLIPHHIMIVYAVQCYTNNHSGIYTLCFILEYLLMLKFVENLLVL